MPTALHTNSKADTRLLVDNQAGTVAGLAVDESQYRTNLTSAGTYVYEDPSDRNAPFYGTIELRFAYDGGESGTLLWHGLDDLSDWYYWISVDSGGLVTVSTDTGAREVTVQLDGGGLAEYLIVVHRGYSSLRVHVWSYDSSTWIIGTTDTFALSIVSGNMLSIGAQGYGTDTYSYGASEISMVRISSRPLSLEEVYLDWIGTTTTDTPTGVTRTPALPWTQGWQHGHFAGPSLLVGGGAVQNHDRRLVGPLLDVRLNDQMNSDNHHGGTGDYGPSAWQRAGLKSGGTAYHMTIEQLWWRPVPPAITHGRVRVFMAHWRTGGTELQSIWLRMYSMNRLPTLNQLAPDPPPPPIESFYVEFEDTQDNDTGEVAGIWLDLGILKLARGGVPYGTYFALAMSIALDTEPTDYDQQYWSVKHVCIDAVTVPAGENDYWGQGGLDEQG